MAGLERKLKLSAGSLRRARSAPPKLLGNANGKPHLGSDVNEAALSRSTSTGKAMSLNDAGVEAKAPKQKRGMLTQTEIVEHVLDVMLRTHCRDLYQSTRNIKELSVTDAKDMLAKADAIVRQFHGLKRLIRKKAGITTNRPQLELFEDEPR